MRLSRESMVPSMRLATLLLVLFLHQTYSQSAGACPKNRDYWERTGEDDVLAAMRNRDNNRVAKNVVIFLGDGMGVTVSTAARIYKGQKANNCGEEGYLSWERLSNMALVKTYNTDKQVPDSAATATAYLSGVKTNWFTVGVDARVQLNDCFASKQKENQVKSVLAWAQAEGKRTGFVTTTRITHATPAATYAHTSNRTWEADFDMPAKWRGNCKDIADQLITENPGRGLNVIMGGGRERFGSCTAGDEPCKSRVDGRNLVQEWLAEKEEFGFDAAYVTNPTELESVSSDVDYVMGLFAKSHLPYVIDMAEVPGNYDAPSLENMMLKALSVLDKGDKGFVLLVEGGRIDHGLHEDWTRKALEETLEFDRAIETAKKELNFEETLMVVTADHSHPITINGYPERGNDILGIAGTDKATLGTDDLPYTTIMYTNGPGYMDKYKVLNEKDDMKKKIMNPVGSLMMGDDSDNEIEDEPQGFSHGQSHMVVRADQSKVDTGHRDYRHLAAVPRKIFDGTHGGEDVAVYAEGPMSHLFHRLHEQSYVAYVMATAACIGPGLKICQATGRAAPTNNVINFGSPINFPNSFASAASFSGINRIGQPIFPGLINPINLLGRHVSVGSLGASSAGASGGSAASAASSSSAAASSSAGASFASSGSASAASSGGASTATAGGATSASTGATSTASAASGGASAAAASASGASAASVRA